MTQAQALKILKTGVNVYLTGSAGSGKTYVLNEYINYLKDHDITVAITASTGIAATHMNGQTIHGWSGIGIRDSLSEYDLEALLEKEYLYKRFANARVLIIDEVSMLHGFRLDMVDRVCKLFKKNNNPFGGLQVVLSGDFFQLPPITRGGNTETSDLIVYSQAWKSMKPAICYLTEQHRQNDDLFTDILNAMRKDSLKEIHYKEIEKRINSKNIHAEATKLYTHNLDVDKINQIALDKLDGKVYKYEMSSKGKDALAEAIAKSCLAPDILFLKKGAQVMFVKNNFEKGYVNGTRGTVVDFLDNNTPIVKCLDGKMIEVLSESWRVEEDGKIKAEIMQLPLRHAWAITIHKSQGMSLDSAEIDLSKSFTYGMGYVALSRVKSLAGIKLVGFHRDALKVDPRILELDERFRDDSEENGAIFSRLSDAKQKELEEKFILKMDGSIAKVEKVKKDTTQKVSTSMITKVLLEEGKTIAQIAKERKLTVGTIISHLEDLNREGEEVKFPHIKPKESLLKIVAKCSKGTDGKLTSIKYATQKAGQNMTFEEIRIARLFI